MDIIINKEAEGKTIREYLRGDLSYSSGMLKKLKFAPGGILVNGSFVTVRYCLCEGDVLSLASEDKEEDVSPYIFPVDLPIGIAFEDSHVTVVDKPYNMPAHPSFQHRDDTVANALAWRYKGTPYVFRPVNRLDRDTSGLMLCASNRLAASKLYRSMISGDINKIYVALLTGVPEKKYGRLISYMGRCCDSIVKRQITSENAPGAKIAVTLYKTVFSKDNVSVVLAVPVTGRTHQLRLHFSQIGCPIIGDTLYGSEADTINRHALHAAYLSFPHPATGKRTEVFSALPSDMHALLPKEAVQIITEELKKAAASYENYFESDL